jgi:hypothetical protein
LVSISFLSLNPLKDFGTDSEDKLAERTRFHVKSALALNGEYKKIKGKKQKASWLERQRALSLEKDTVSPEGI